MLFLQVGDELKMFCMCCGERWASTRLNLAVCVVCAGLVSEPDKEEAER